MFNFLSHKERINRHAERQLELYSRPSVDFFVLIAISASLATLGLALDNSAIIIGAMVVAPLVTPIFGFSLYLILFKPKGIGESIFSILTGTILAIMIATLFGFLILLIDGQSISSTTEILSRTKPDLLYFIIALLSGLAGAFAYVRPKLSEKIVGIAISAAIIPPLAVMGLCIAMQNWKILMASEFLFLLNFIGICFGSIIMFLILGFGKEEELKM
ncbi:MAG: TIGR00341 family protein [Candidatus Magasanikbacteria bacterium]